jgi:hypothetical protein
MGKTDVERIAVLETKLENFLAGQEARDKELSEIKESVGEMKKLLEQAKGARWAFMALLTLGGGAGGAALTKIIQLPFKL